MPPGSLNHEPDKNALNFLHSLLDPVSVTNNRERGQDPGGTPLYKPYRYVLPERVAFMGLFGLKTLPILV